MKTLLLKTFAIFIYVSAYVNWAHAQSPGTTVYFQIKGEVKPLCDVKPQEVTLQLLKANDSLLVKVEFPNAGGIFTFDKIPQGVYKLRTVHLGLNGYTSGIITLDKNVDLGTIQLSARVTSLKEVTVTASRPFIQQQFDKTVVNVESSIVSAGSTAMDVLEKSPGISVDQNDNLSMRGRQGIMVMIDGKKVPLSGSELAIMLRGMSANSIDKIELITNPSSKYDAAGNSGLIDIKLKKDKRNGTNGSLTSSVTQGKYIKTNSSLNLNTRTKKFNVFSSYNYVYRKEYTNLKIYREFDNAGIYTGADDQKNYFHANYATHNYRAGLDYYASPKTVIGFMAGGFNLDINRLADNYSTRIDAANQPYSFAQTNSSALNSRFNPSLNLNFKYTLDTTGREITADLDYARYNTGDNQNYATNYYGLDNKPTSTPYLLYGTLNGHLNIKSAKIDYTQPLKSKNSKIESGLKSSWVDADNNLEFFDRSNGSNIADVGKSNHFLYNEQINAAYVNISKHWDKLHTQLGLRLENTNAHGIQLNNGETFNRTYTQLFPSGYIGYQFNNKHELGVSLSRRINRPTYNQLNPFKYYLNASTYSTGNPFLNPELTYSFEVTHTYNQKLTMKYSYSHTTANMIMVLSRDLSQPNLIMQTDRNLAEFNYYSFSMSAPVQPVKWLTSTNNLTFFYGQYSGNLVNANLNSGKATIQLNSNNNITISPSLSGEIIGNFQSRQVYAFLDINPAWTISAGIQKQLWARKATLKLNISDPFYTNTVQATTRTPGYEEHFNQQRDSRTVTLNFTYRFGKAQGASTPKRSGGADDEKRRAN